MIRLEARDMFQFRDGEKPITSVVPFLLLQVGWWLWCHLSVGRTQRSIK